MGLLSKMVSVIQKVGLVLGKRHWGLKYLSIAQLKDALVY